MLVYRVRLGTGAGETRREYGVFVGSIMLPTHFATLYKHLESRLPPKTADECRAGFYAANSWAVGPRCCSRESKGLAFFSYSHSHRCSHKPGSLDSFGSCLATVAVL